MDARSRFRSHLRVLPLCLAALLVSSATGCVHRRMTVRSNPPGALVFVDNVEIGTTPVSTDFIYYGTRRIELVKDGYETLVVHQKIPAPWFQWFPLDFVTENLVPADIRDERAFDFAMRPQTVVPTEQLLDRASQLRQTSRAAGAALPVTNTLFPSATVPPAMPELIAPPANTLPPPAGYQPSPGYPPPQGAYPMQPAAPYSSQMPQAFTPPGQAEYPSDGFMAPTFAAPPPTVPY